MLMSPFRLLFSIIVVDQGCGQLIQCLALNINSTTDYVIIILLSSNTLLYFSLSLGTHLIQEMAISK